MIVTDPHLVDEVEAEQQRRQDTHPMAVHLRRKGPAHQVRRLAAKTEVGPVLPGKRGL